MSGHRDGCGAWLLSSDDENEEGTSNEMPSSTPT